MPTANVNNQAECIATKQSCSDLGPAFPAAIVNHTCPKAVRWTVRAIRYTYGTCTGALACCASALHRSWPLASAGRRGPSPGHRQQSLGSRDHIVRRNLPWTEYMHIPRCNHSRHGLEPMSHEEKKKSPSPGPQQEQELHKTGRLPYRTCAP